MYEQPACKVLFQNHECNLNIIFSVEFRGWKRGTIICLEFTALIWWLLCIACTI